MAPRYGRGPKGERVEGVAPHGHWQTTTFVAALRHDRITAPCVFDGPINGPCFRAWTEQALAPTPNAGDIVILDNLSSHKVAGIKQAVEARGAKLVYLPPYSPDLNPSKASRPSIRPMEGPRSADRRRRAGLRQAQAPLAHGQRPNRRCPARHNPQPAQGVLSNRMPELYQKFRLFQLNGNLIIYDFRLQIC
jgi:transposase